MVWCVTCFAGCVAPDATTCATAVAPAVNLTTDLDDGTSEGANVLAQHDLAPSAKTMLVHMAGWLQATCRHIAVAGRFGWQFPYVCTPPKA